MRPPQVEGDHNVLVPGPCGCGLPPIVGLMISISLTECPRHQYSALSSSVIVIQYLGPTSGATHMLYNLILYVQDCNTPVTVEHLSVMMVFVPNHLWCAYETRCQQ